MKTRKRARYASTRSRIVYWAFGSLVLLGFAGYSPVFAQTVTTRPVARLINASGTDPRNRPGGIADSRLLPGTPVVASPSIGEATLAERRAFETTNELRSKNGLAPLDWDPELCIIARRHSRNMSVLGFFSHQTPEGLRLRDRARLGGIRYRVIAENIAYNQGFEDPGAFAVERWTVSRGTVRIFLARISQRRRRQFCAADGTVS